MLGVLNLRVYFSWEGDLEDIKVIIIIMVLYNMILYYMLLLSKIPF